MRTDNRTPPSPLDHLARSLRARASAPGGQARPAAILWTDRWPEWRALLPAALARIPELFALGDYGPAHRTGPAIWLRCVIDRAISIDALPGRHPHHLPPRGRTRPAPRRRGLRRRTEAARRADVPRSRPAHERVPPAFRESVRVGEQNLYTGGKMLVGDRDARAHQYTVQMQPRDNDKSGNGAGTAGAGGDGGGGCWIGRPLAMD